jgi:hypothetical protein
MMVSSAYCNIDNPSSKVWYDPIYLSIFFCSLDQNYKHICDNIEQNG